MQSGYFIQDDIGEAKRLLSLLRLYARQQGHADPLGSAACMVGISRGTAENLIRERRKSIPARISAAIRKAYLAICMKQLAHLEAQVDELKERCGDDSVVDLGDAVARLVERLREASERSR